MIKLDATLIKTVTRGGSVTETIDHVRITGLEARDTFSKVSYTYGTVDGAGNFVPSDLLDSYTITVQGNGWVSTEDVSGVMSSSAVSQILTFVSQSFASFEALAISEGITKGTQGQ